MKACLVFFICAVSFGAPMDFWRQGQRRGANFFNNFELKERFEAAKAAGIEVVRLAPNKWLNGRPHSELGNFLIGPKDKFESVDLKDVAYLKKVLDDANAAGIKVVLTMLSLPAHRWSQHNGGVQERRLFEDKALWDLAIRFWVELAKELEGHPALVGYNILNEPSPEKLKPRLVDWHTDDYSAWYEKVRGTAADLNLFYRKIIPAIRAVDAKTPIVLDAGFYATPWAFKVLEPVGDKYALYSFHMYEPNGFAGMDNKGKYRYPGMSPVGERGETPVPWDKAALSEFLAPVREWQAQHRVPSSHIFMSEFGAFRHNEGVTEYFSDLISIFNAERWHWAFYSYREDDWEGMNYELPPGAPCAEYFEFVKKGKMPGPDIYSGSPIFDVLKKALSDRRTSKP